MPKTLDSRVDTAEQEYGERITHIGGIPKQRYYTPDGRVVWSIPSWVEWGGKDTKGNVLSGTRDRNLDSGWSLSPPSNPKLRCVHCDRWHDTKAEVAKCAAKRKALDKKHMDWARRKTKSDEGEVAELRKELAEFKDMVKKLMEKGV